MSRIRISHVTHVNGACLTYERVTSHMWVSHVTHTNESCHICEWGMSHIWMSHFIYVPHVDTHCHKYDWGMSHIWMRHVTYVTQMNESCHTHEQQSGCTDHDAVSRHTCEWGMSHIWMRHVTHMNQPCDAYEWVKSHTWTTERMHRPWRCVTSHMWMRHVTHMNEACHTYGSAMWRVWMCHITHINNREDASTVALHGDRLSYRDLVKMVCVVCCSVLQRVALCCSALTPALPRATWSRPTLGRFSQKKQTIHKSIWKNEAWCTLSLIQTSRANPVLAQYPSNFEKKCNMAICSLVMIGSQWGISSLWGGFG